MTASRAGGVILPGATLGVLGGGQLGRMFALAARRMGYRAVVLCPEDDAPAAQVADHQIVAAYDDLGAVAELARRASVVTFEFENVSTAATEAAERLVPVRPAGGVLHTTQHRLREKGFLRDAGLPVTPFAAVRTEPDLAAAAGAIGFPAVLKTAAWGYDGKGQHRVDSPEALGAAWDAIGRAEAVLERMIDFERELSVVAARGLDGTVVAYDPVDNHHANHILDVTRSPAAVSAAVRQEAVEISRAVLEALGVVGVLCVEFFLAPGGELMINELAPRPHNSGHGTIDGCVTCQFEQQVRTVTGLPLGSTAAHRPWAMANLLGDLWAQGTPNWPAACAAQGVKLHLYGKGEPRPGRKMGHLTAVADTADAARDRVLRAREALVTGTRAPATAP